MFSRFTIGIPYMQKKLIFFFLFVLIGTTTYAIHEESLLVPYISEKFSTDPNSLSITRFLGGVSNKTYLVCLDGKQKIVCKLFTKKSLEEVLNLEGIMCDLRKIGFKIPETISIDVLDNRFPLQISEFKSGFHVQEEDLDSTAYLMGKLHTTNLNIPVLEEKYKDSIHFKNLFLKCSDWSYCKELKEIYDELDLEYLEEIPKGMIHGDFSYTNLIKSSDDIFLIDFDHVCISYYLTDLARCQMFYAFDKEGNFLEKKLNDFIFYYEQIRPLSALEKENFYTHMTLMMIETALEMYYRRDIIQDLPNSIISYKENQTLLPEILVKKIKNIRQKKDLYKKDIKSKKTPIIFLGMSGAGKTTMIKGLFNLRPDIFHIPRFTCTRKPRVDDELNQFEYISREEFVSLKNKNIFLFIMQEQDRYYGYRKSIIDQIDKHPLLNCSPYGLENVKHLAGIYILIQGDTERGLSTRNDSEVMQRKLVNQKAWSNFYSQDEFLKRMDIIHCNVWGYIETSIESLLNKILLKLKEIENEPYLYRAA